MFATVIGRSSENYRAADRAAAQRTALSFLAAVDEVAGRPVEAALRAKDGFPEDAADGGKERLHFGGREAIDASLRMDRGLVERLVGVEVSDPGDDVLRHQE